jgi:Alb1
MGKGSIAKKKGNKNYNYFMLSKLIPVGPSIRSRAARKATSPSIDTDKSLKDIKPPPESVDYRPAILAAHHGAGIIKKSKNGRKAVLSSKARRRHEKSMDRAEVVLGRVAKKIERSRGQAKSIQSRKKNWDDINRQMPTKHKRASDIKGESGHSRESIRLETDEAMDGADETNVSAPPRSSVTEPTEVPLSMEDEDEDDGIE